MILTSCPQSGLHSEVCDIDYKLHAIIASRKRCAIQSIQEETATNIYYPTPLVGISNPPQPGTQQGIGYRNMRMGGMSVQPTGTMSVQMTGQMHGMGMGGGMNGMGMGMGSPMSGGMGGMGMGGMNVGGYPPFHRGNNAPAAYNPHQHVHYPYQPQPLDINPQTTRGMPYSGPGMQHYGPGPMNGMNHGPGPMQVNHTGMSQMHTGYPSSRGLGGPMQMNMTPSPGMHGQMGMGGAMIGNNGAGTGMGTGNNMHMPYAHTGQNHLHVGLGAGPLGVNSGMGPGMGGMAGGMNMGMGMGQFGAGPHPGLSVHGGEQGVLGKSNQIWITGEFFGVQRARDMLLNVAVQKVRAACGTYRNR